MRPINISSSKAIDYYYALDPFFNQHDSQWAGEVAEIMGLTSKVTKDTFAKVLNGQDMNGNQIIKNGHGKSKQDQSIQKHRAAIDIALSVPKSVSIAALHCGHNGIIDAHKTAVQQTINEIEQEFIKARHTTKGKTQVIDAKGLFATFDHSTSRANDPQLHTHVLIMNMCHTEKGLRAVYNDLIFKNQRYINSYYQQALSSELVKMGYQIENNQGNFEIKGITEKMIQTFSKRTGEIEKELKNITNPNLNAAQRRNKATIESRQEKDRNIKQDELKSIWESEYSASAIDKMIKYNKQIKPQKAITAIHHAANFLHKTESSFNRFELMNMAFQLSRGVSNAEMKKAFNQAIDIGSIQSTGKRVAKSGLIIENFATPQMIKTEKTILSLYQQGLNKMKPIKKSVDLKNYDYFTAGQKAFVQSVFESSHQFNLIQGDAGTGKTSAIKAIKELQHTSKLMGLAYTGKAASEIESKAGIPSMTIDQLISQYNKRKIQSKAMDKLSQKYAGIWLIDEASMLGSAQLSKLMKMAKFEGAKVFFIGDSKQLQAIAAGKMFKELQTNKHIELTETLRQKQEIIKKAVSLVKNKHIETSLQMLKKTGHVIENKSIDHLISDYINSKGDMIITSRNIDREMINQKTRMALKAKGLLLPVDVPFTIEKPKRFYESQQCFAQNYETGQEIIINNVPGVQSGSRFIVTGIHKKRNQLKVESSPTLRVWDEKTESFKHIERKKKQTLFIDPMKSDITAIETETKAFTPGERIIFTRNDKALGVKNGHIGIIQNISPEMMQIKLDDRTLKINQRDYASFDHAYALTVYKSQGQTAKNVFIHASERGQHTTEFLYTALSRASHSAKIYCDNFQQFVCQCLNAQEKQTSLNLGYAT